MAVPTFDRFILPFLEVLFDGKIHSIKEIKLKLAKKFKMSDEDLSELTSSGMRRFDDRVGWARTYLKKSLLISSPERARFKIEKRGLKALKDEPDNMILYLNQYPEFVEFRGKRRVKKTKNSAKEIIEIIENEENQTPSDMIKNATELLRKELKDEIFNRIFSIKKDDDRAKFFELLVTNLICKMGYGGSEEYIIQKCGHPGDGGVDGIVKQDILGLDKILIQTKCNALDKKVPVEDLRNFGGALLHKRACKAVFFTTSTYSSPAIEYAKSNEIALVDGDKLIELMSRYNVGVQTQEIIEIKKVDQDFFDEYCYE